MSNTLRKIYKQNCEQGYPSAPEHQSSLSENTPESPVKTSFYAELNDSQEARSVVAGATAKSAIAPSSGNVSVANQKKNRHRRLGSNDSKHSFSFTPKQIDRRNIKMVHMETQTDILHIDNITVSSTNFNIPTMLVKSSVASTEFKDDSVHEEHMADEDDVRCDSYSIDNGNIISASNTRDETDRIYDYMNSNEQLDIVDIRESSDEDNVEKLNRRVSQFFNQNQNGSIIENRLLFNIMAARRSCISINDKEVTVLSRGNSLRTSSNAIFAQTNGDSCRRDALCYKSDHNCNNDDGDDSWTDEEGEESDRNYSLRRKR